MLEPLHLELKVLLLSLVLLSHLDHGNGADLELLCADGNATVTFTVTGLTELGVDTDDYLIANDMEQDDVSGLEAACKYDASNGAGSITFTLTQCNPQYFQDSDNIYIVWYLRNAEQGTAKRADVCRKINCTFPRKVNVTSAALTALVDKVTLVDISDSGVMIELEIQIFNDSSRTTEDNVFFCPETVYARVRITTPGVPDTFYPQIMGCTASDVQTGGMLSYSLIMNGVADDSSVVVGEYERLQQDFSFNSFLWSGGNNGDAVWLTCDVYVCNSDAGVDCSMAQPPVLGARRRRRREVIPQSEYIHTVSLGPVFSLPGV